MKLIRREFLIQALALPAVTVLLARFLSACAKDEPASTALHCSQGFTATSSTDSSHSHTVTVAQADITAGVQKTYTTSNSGGHTHTVTFSAADMTKFAANQDVTETNDADAEGHTHTFAITCTA